MDPKGYETKPWWPYVQNLQEQIDAGGSGGGGGDVILVPFMFNKVKLGSVSGYVSTKTFDEIRQILDSGKAALALYPSGTGIIKNPAYAFVIMYMLEPDQTPGGIILEGNVQATYIKESVSAEYAGRVIIEG